jgi:RNA polymerase sigma factor (sigma-70 family)
MSQSDQELLEQFTLKHDERAFEVLFQRHSPMVMGVCRRYLNESDATDTFQAVFLVLVKNASNLKRHSSIGSWLYRVTVNACLDVKKSLSTRQKGHEPLEEAMHIDKKQEEQLEWLQMRPAIDEELCRLSEKDRAPIVLCYLEGFSYEETCKQLGLTYKALEKRLERTRSLLKDRFARRGLVLSASALAMLLTKNASAAIDPQLMSSTVKAATEIVTGNTATSGVISTKIAMITQRIMKHLFMKKLINVTAACSLMLTSIGGIGMITYKVVASENAQDRSDINKALFDAVIAGDLTQVKNLLDKGADANATQQQGEGKGITVLMFAASKGNVDITKLLIERGADVNGKQLKSMNTPLMLAAVASHLEVVNLLLEKGADVNMRNKSRETALKWAIRYSKDSKSKTDVVKSLRQHGGIE